MYRFLEGDTPSKGTETFCHTLPYANLLSAYPFESFVISFIVNIVKSFIVKSLSSVSFLNKLIKIKKGVPGTPIY
jgi:hypothetical protein